MNPREVSEEIVLCYLSRLEQNTGTGTYIPFPMIVAKIKDGGRAGKKSKLAREVREKLGSLVESGRVEEVTVCYRNPITSPWGSTIAYSAYRTPCSQR